MCIDTVNDNPCAGGNWTPLGNVTGVTARLTAKKAYYWQVRAINTGGTTAANSGTWWKLTTK